MQKNLQRKRNWFFMNAGLFVLVVIALQACQKNPLNNLSENNFLQVNLVANNSSYGATTVDASLRNGWGIAFAPTGPAWVSSQAGGVSNIYNAAGAILRPSVTIPTNGAATGGSPTGAVFNGTTGFRLSNGNAAKFIFAGTDGVISAWNTGNAAEVAKNDMGAAYTGLTMAMDNGVPYLYAANFREGKVDVYDTLWNEVSRPFADFTIPSGYSPFNVQSVGDNIYVTYAKEGSDGHEEKGTGLGFVDIYKTNGKYVKRFASHGELNAPWGITWAPSSFFGTAMNTPTIILVGNFGNGRINAYDAGGSFLGALYSHGKPIVIDGLWGLSFAPATATTVNPNWLFFAAGPNDEADGLFGYLTMDMPKK